MGVTFQITGAHARAERPLIRGAVSLDGVSVRLGGDVVVDRLRGSIGVSPDTLTLDSLTGVFADGPFELSGAVARQDRTLALMARAQPDLDALDRLGLVPAGATLSGDATLDVSVAGSLDAPDSIEVAGVVTVTGLQAKHTRLGVPFYVPEGELELSGRDIRWSELDVLVGRDAVVTSGTVSDLVSLPGRETVVPRFEASIRAPRLDLSAVLPPHAGAPDVTYAQVAFAHLGGRSVEGRAASAALADLGLSRPASLPARGILMVELDTLDFRRYHTEGLSARVEMSDSTLVVDAPSFRVWGGDAEALVRVGVGQQRGEPFSLRLSIEGADAREFLTATTPIVGVSGTLTLDLEAAGAVDATLLPVARDLTGRAEISIADGHVHDTGPNLVLADFLGSEEWTDLPFETWVTTLDIVDRRLEIRESKLAGAQAFVALDGMVHLDGSHDVSLGLSIPPGRLQTVSLRRTGIGQSVLDHLSAAGTSLDLGLRMSGVLRAPVLEPDASNAVALAR
jgi:hypothetical protein